MSGAEETGRRAARNTGVRAAAEIIGKLSTLILFAAIGRALGQTDLGVLTFAFAYTGIALTPVGFGTDSYLMRQVARSREEADRLLWDVVVFKVVVALPVLAISLGLLGPLGYDGGERAVIALMALMLLLDTLAKSCHSIFTAVERSDLLAGTLVAQRLFTAAVGVGVLVAGAGLVTVAAVFAAGAAIHLGLAVLWLGRAVPVPPLRVSPRSWGALTRVSGPFAAQDVLTVLLFKVDAVLLSLLAAEAAVGRYGAAYRLVEATMFVGFALNGAFAAMYIYLSRDSDPPLGAVFGRSLKVALILLLPITVVFATVPAEVCALIFGEEFREAGETLRILAPIVVLLVIVAQSSTLVINRTSPRRFLPLTAGAVVLNISLNLALVPGLEDRGAAIAMLATEAIFAAAALILVVRETGPLPWHRLGLGPLLAGAVMAAPLLLLRDEVLLALPAGAVTYIVVVVAIERRVAPEDLAFVGRLIRRRAAR